MRYAKLYWEDVTADGSMPPLVKDPIQQIQLTKYAGASGDFNPIHQDDAFARAAGMGGVFAHGMLSMGFVAQSVTDWATKPIDSMPWPNTSPMPAARANAASWCMGLKSPEAPA